MGSLSFRLAETCSWLCLINKSCFWTEFVIFLLVILSNTTRLNHLKIAHL